MKVYNALDKSYISIIDSVSYLIYLNCLKEKVIQETIKSMISLL